MANEKRYQDLNNDELRAAIREYNNQSQPASPKQPDVPGTEKLSPEIRDAAATLYGQAILAKPADRVTPEEKDFLRAGIAAWQKDNS